MSSIGFEGYCPHCILSGKLVHLSINRGDIYECPDCHLMVALASLMRAVLLRRRGGGNFRDPDDPHYSSRNLVGLILVRESEYADYEPDKFNCFKNQDELEAYLDEVTEPDPCG